MSDSTNAAVAEGKTSFFSRMKYGKHTFLHRLKDFVTPAGNQTGLKCLFGGHTWHVDTPKKFQFDTGPQYTMVQGPDGEQDVEVLEREFPDDPVYSCFCIECGAGSYFKELPESVFEIDYWCYRCENTIGGEAILEHAKDHFEERNMWPVFSAVSSRTSSE